MGSNTLKSFPGGKPLKDRHNIVLYPDGEDRDDCKIVRSLDELFAGQMIYKTLLSYCDDVLVTKVDAEGAAEAFFENLDKNPHFKLVYESEPEQTNGYTIRFTTYKNLNVKVY